MDWAKESQYQAAEFVCKHLQLPSSPKRRAYQAPAKESKVLPFQLRGGVPAPGPLRPNHRDPNAGIVYLLLVILTSLILITSHAIFYNSDAIDIAAEEDTEHIASTMAEGD